MSVPAEQETLTQKSGRLFMADTGSLECHL
jgi:hypothetical protein